MTNIVANWWRSRQFRTALKRGDARLAEQLLRKIQSSGAKLSWEEQLFKNKVQADRYLHARNNAIADLNEQLQQALERTEESARYLHARNNAIADLNEQLQQASKRIEELEQKTAFQPDDTSILTPELNFTEFVSKSFKLIERDENLLQCSGIDERIFDDFEASLVEYLREEIDKIPEYIRKSAITEALEDIEALKSGLDPKYNFNLTPQVYFMKYFLDNLYCAYLAWFLIYKSGLLPTNLNILDVAAGPGTVAYGLALLLRSSSCFFQSPQMHISYYSLEKQAPFQYRGLQFWRRYIESQQIAPNTYFRFDTADILDYDSQSKKLPQQFFDFVVVSHCFFTDIETRNKSHQAYSKIFKNSLKDKGHVLLVIQDKKLFKSFNVRQGEDRDRERRVIIEFVEELGLNLVWYKYLTSIGQRTPIISYEFGKFASENLPHKKYMGQLMQQYFGIKYKSHYVLDDYVILANKS